MGPLDDVGRLDATAQAALVRKKEVSPSELVEAAIARIERLNATVNAVVTPMYDSGRAAARGPIPDGAFAGVPFLLKDFITEVAGVRFTEGVAFLQDYTPTEDSELVRRYKQAGLIIVGKTNLPALALGATTEPQLFGPTHNPWDLSRTPGGSSGGSAAAVAARLVPMAHGNDAGGSGRRTRPETRESTMAEVLRGRQAVPLEEVVLGQAFQLETLLNVLERKRMIRKAAVLEEIKRLRRRG